MKSIKILCICLILTLSCTHKNSQMFKIGLKDTIYIRITDSVKLYSKDRIHWFKSNEEIHFSNYSSVDSLNNKYFRVKHSIGSQTFEQVNFIPIKTDSIIVIYPK